MGHREKEMVMKKADVKTGEVYSAKVSGNIVPVRIDRENPRGGWDGSSRPSAFGARPAPPQARRPPRPPTARPRRSRRSRRAT